MQRLDLATGQAHQRVAVAEGVVYEGERMVARKGAEPERDLGKVDGHRVSVDAVEALLGDQAPGVDHLVFVRRDGRHRAVRAPRVDQGVSELATGLDQECAGAHRRIADLEVQDLLRRRRPAVLTSQPIQEGIESVADDRLGQFTRRVVGAGAPSLFVGLQHQGARWGDVRGRGLVQNAVQRHVQIAYRLRFTETLRDFVRDGAIGALLKPSPAAGVRLCQQCVEIDRVRRLPASSRA